MAVQVMIEKRLLCLGGLGLWHDNLTCCFLGKIMVPQTLRGVRGKVAGDGKHDGLQHTTAGPCSAARFELGNGD